MKSYRRLFILPLAHLLLFARPAFAAPAKPGSGGGYWSQFIEHWQKVFQEQDGIAMAVVVVGIVSIFIITRGKWQK